MNLLEIYKIDMELQGLARTTIESNVIRIKQYMTWANQQGIDPAKADREVIKSFLSHEKNRGMKKATLQRNFSTLTSFFDFLEEEGLAPSNPVRIVRKKYLRAYKRDAEERQIISIADAAQMVAATIDTRDRAILLTLLKTGIRKGELVSLDVDDVDLQEMSIKLKPTGKRTNRTVFFDHETARALERWIKARNARSGNSPALFLGEDKSRLKRCGIGDVVVRAADRVDLHDSSSNKLDEHFTPHCCRHWFTTHLLRAGMPRDFVKELWGDARREAIDIYNHIDKKELKESYLAHIPQLGI